MTTRRSSARLARGASATQARDDDETTTASIPGPTPRSTRRTTRTSSIIVEVAIPAKAKDSLSTASSLSPPSVDSTSREDSILDTPATSVPVSPPESDNNTSRKTRKRVSASRRALQLRASALALPSSASTSSTRGKRTVSQMLATESSDAALARELQLEEYGGSKIKRQRNTLDTADFTPMVQDSEDELLPDWDEQMSPQSSRRRSLRSRPKSQTKNAGDMRMLDDGHGTDDADDYAYSPSDDDASEADEASPEVEEEVPVVTPPATRRARNPNNSLRSRVRARALRETETALPYHMGRRAARERRKLEKQHPLITTMWKDLENMPAIVPQQAEQPAGISRKLKSFQLEGLNWMMQQEKTQYKGGLLGDEMGMGKTIQAVSLLMSDYPVGKPSLVVVPPVALMQWQSEINEYTDGKLKVLVYHNSNHKVKHLKRKDLLAYDVIMISYSGLESMYRKEMKGWNREDGIVKEDSVIHSIDFHRLVLDEAHSIKQRTTSVARACFALKSTYKWCLSGTPVQNRIGEFFSLLRFLEVRPFACYFCKVCKCQELHWSQDAEKRCTHCHHSGFSHVSVFNQEILNPITESHGQARQDALRKLRLITDRIMLRRLKRDHTSSMELPPKRVIIHNEFFGEIERDFSTSIMTNTTRQFDTYVSRGVMLNNYANIFGLIMQMRQVANHPDLILKKHGEGGQNVLVCNICDEPAESPIRSRCHHEFCRQCAKDYMRSFDADSVVDCPRCHIPLSIDFEQPEIEQEEDVVKKNSIINRIRMEDWTSSTKIEMLVYDLYKLRSKKQTHKSIVFSQFTSMLQLVEWRLRRAGFNTVMLDGSMTPAQRQNSIDHFMKNVDVEVFLVSLKAGGVALNLTEASRVFIVDPWWNPAAEWQSADRCHRIGQRRPCVITRLCIEDSVESRMVALQEKKANMINGTINKDQGDALEKLTPEDMQFLFRGS
ncbi:DNA excision repair protein Rad16, putative [Talaromyces stipitatus ATCC 10500]|uniref:DNA excision repair protein Rad16, putative n=1 Tax=Talaromyces stipitatus (strain ATCC 10500 / CBS 375.48 / QM 6759 / NRRL 1006) TaxID=441959 RepID=B8LZH2_TALSN|nr:DNA excision repair protein Rad16, putative [Talaromyces stipitatus ATCC 10500]EED21725.1 DNA excision repair protein Rad16, putative [Talaromyces stipitatus ATCC 10500]